MATARGAAAADRGGRASGGRLAALLPADARGGGRAAARRARFDRLVPDARRGVDPPARRVSRAARGHALAARRRATMPTRLRAPSRAGTRRRSRMRSPSAGCAARGCAARKSGARIRRVTSLARVPLVEIASHRRCAAHAAARAARKRSRRAAALGRARARSHARAGRADLRAHARRARRAGAARAQPEAAVDRAVRARYERRQALVLSRSRSSIEDVGAPARAARERARLLRRLPPRRARAARLRRRGARRASARHRGRVDRLLRPHRARGPRGRAGSSSRKP